MNEEITKKRLEDLLKTEHDMKKMLAEKDVKDMETLDKNKWDKIKDEIIKAVKVDSSPPKAKFGVPDKDATDKESYCKSFGEFLWMVKMGDPRVSHLKTAMSTTDAQGGYTIPETWTSEILGRLNEMSVAISEVTPIDMVGDTLHLNSILTDLTGTTPP